MNQIVEMKATLEAEFDFSKGHAELLSIYLCPEFGESVEVTEVVPQSTKLFLQRDAELNQQKERVRNEIYNKESYDKQEDYEESSNEESSSKEAGCEKSSS